MFKCNHKKLAEWFTVKFCEVLEILWCQEEKSNNITEIPTQWNEKKGEF